MHRYTDSWSTNLPAFIRCKESPRLVSICAFLPYHILRVLYCSLVKRSGILRIHQCAVRFKKKLVLPPSSPSGITSSIPISLHEYHIFSLSSAHCTRDTLAPIYCVDLFSLFCKSLGYETDFVCIQPCPKCRSCVIYSKFEGSYLLHHCY